MVLQAAGAGVGVNGRAMEIGYEEEDGWEG